ncbi:uncharacterized protein LOC113326483 [Papaver somniferum]|uniref:uncharacterized protein LOC113326483 n=1 Tax=Papaver somniferum TaxID=3469 RepID=UPI000E7059E6|nr:uncharacterized protein LOC113326483 [Papaver somniferum]
MRSGGLVILWNDSVNLEILSSNTNVIHCRIHNLLESDWDLFCVYVPLSSQKRNEFWHNFSLFTAQIQNPWCMVGDLNGICSSSEKHGGSQKFNSANNGFKDFIQDRSLVDLGYIGPAFTWSNGATLSEPIYEKLDRAMCTTNWILMFKDTEVLHLPRISSDHNTHRENQRKRKLSNKIEYFWMEHPEFKDVVIDAWSTQ